MKQEFDKYTAEDLKVWQTLFERQQDNIQNHASSYYRQALVDMKSVINGEELPNFEKINEWLSHRTGWQIQVVTGLIGMDDFFEMLAQKKFPSSTWLRSIEQLDYLEQPDMFHDTFGHVPLLSNPKYSNFMQEYGKLGCEYFDDKVRLKKLKRLYWFTIEFGLIQEEELKIFGAGILSSFGESNVALNAEAKEHLPFDLNRMLNTGFIFSEMQERYFITPDFETLENSIQAVRRKWKAVEVAA